MSMRSRSDGPEDAPARLPESDRGFELVLRKPKRINGGGGLGGKPDFPRGKAFALAVSFADPFMLNQSSSSSSASNRFCASRAFAFAFSRLRLPTLLSAEKP